MPEEETNEQGQADRVSRPAILTIVMVLVVMALVALHLNWVRWHRDTIEQVIVTPIATPTPTP